MPCLDDAQLQMLVEGTLERSEAERVRTHLTECSGCRAALATYKQLMWDLQQPGESESELPAEMDALHSRLMTAWKKQQASAKAAAKRSPRSLVPSWASYSVEWTRHMPVIGRVLSGIGGSLRPFQGRRKRRGGDRR